MYGRSIILAALVISTGCELFDELRTIANPRRPVSGPVAIGTDWQEITPPAPLEVFAKRLTISVRTDAIDGFDESDPDHQRLVFRGGGTGRVQARLLDGDGATHELQLVGYGGEGGGIYLGVPSAPGSPDFSSELEFVRVDVRSDVAFDATRIEWIAEVQK